MTNQPEPTVVKTGAGVTVTFDVAEFAREIKRGYYGAPDDIGVPEPGTHADPILDAVIARLTAEALPAVREEAVKAARQQITEQVRQIVADTLDAPYQAVTEYGYPRGGETTLREQIAAEIKDWSTKVDGRDMYKAGTTRMAKFVAEQVDRAMKEDLTATVAENRNTIRDAMRKAAARLLADEAARR